MRLVPFALLAILIRLYLPETALALSDADHIRFSQESPDFVRAEARLNAVWKQLRAALPRAEFQKALEDQRVWIHVLRDEEAKAEAGAASPASAYAAVTTRRAEVLEQLLKQKNAAATDKSGLGTAKQPAAITHAEAVPSPALPSPPGASADFMPRGPSVEAVPERPRAKETTVHVPPAVNGTVLPGVAGKAVVPAPSTSATPMGPATSATTGSGPRKTGPVSGEVSPAADQIIGDYRKENGLVNITLLEPGIYNVSVNAAAPDAFWVCKAEGAATLEGNTLNLTDRESPDAGPILLSLEGDKLIVSYRHSPDFCGSGGTLGGVYLREAAH